MQEDANKDLQSTVAERTAELEAANQELSQLARRDALTGLSNRLAANERLLHEFHR
jgi:diguanylate cyclase